MTVSADERESGRALAELIVEAGRAVAMTGAGASAASGVPTYRGAGGSWTRYDPARYASIDYFQKDPGYYWRFFRDERYPALSRAKPNPVHVSLAPGVATLVLVRNTAACPCRRQLSRGCPSCRGASGAQNCSAPAACSWPP